MALVETYSFLTVWRLIWLFAPTSLDIKHPRGCYTYVFSANIGFPSFHDVTNHLSWPVMEKWRHFIFVTTVTFMTLNIKFDIYRQVKFWWFEYFKVETDALNEVKGQVSQGCLTRTWVNMAVCYCLALDSCLDSPLRTAKFDIECIADA